MYPKSSLVFAAALAVFSAFEGTYGYGGVAGAKHDVEKPRFMQRNVKRQYLNTTTTIQSDLDRIRQSKEEEQKKQSQSKTPTPEGPVVLPPIPSSTPSTPSVTSTPPPSTTPTSSTPPASSTPPSTSSAPQTSANNPDSKVGGDLNLSTPPKTSKSSPEAKSSQSQNSKTPILPSVTASVPGEANVNSVVDNLPTSPALLPTNTPKEQSSVVQNKVNDATPDRPSSTPIKSSSSASSDQGGIPVVGGAGSDILQEPTSKSSSSNRFGGSSGTQQQPSPIKDTVNSVANTLAASVTPILSPTESNVNKEVINSKLAASSVVEDLAKSLNNIPASVTSNGVFKANPEQSKAASRLEVAQSKAQELPVVSDTGSKVLDTVQSDVQKASSLPNVAASLTAGSNGVTLPQETGLPSGQSTKNTGQKLDSLQSSAVSDGILLAAPSVTLKSGSVVPNEALTAGSSVASLPASITQSNGDVVVNPAITASSNAASLPASITQSNGQVIANPVLTRSAPTASLPASLTLSNGEVIANPSRAPVTESGSPGLASGVPSQSVLALPVGSKTLSNGDVVPITASASQPSPAKVSANSASEAAANLASGSGVAKEQSVPPNTNAATPASASGASEAAQVSPGPSNPPAQATPSAQTAKSPGPTDGPVATGPQSYPTNGRGPNSQRPTAYDSNTVLPVESSIVYEASSSPVPTGTQPAATGLPSDVPLVLYPPGPKAKRPPNTSLIQIGFLFPLNYDFVWTHEQSQRQIFTYLPIGVSYSLGIDRVNVTMQTLRAWDTTQDLHYITTLALMWIPSAQVDALKLAIKAPAGKFYNHPDPSIRTLMRMVNNAIAVEADNLDDTDTQTGTTPDSSSTSGAAPIGGGISNSSPVKASSVGIGIGVVFGAAAYGAAMFFVARRYRKRRQSHARSPSMFSSPVMSHAGADPAAGQALMSGAMGAERSVSPYYDRAESRGSARSGGSSGRQQISAPVMAENSLGWN